MTTFTARTANEQEIIRKAYEFEIEAIESLDWTRNPYIEQLFEMGGEELVEALNLAVEMKYCGA